jgi:hypothetical protein
MHSHFKVPVLIMGIKTDVIVHHTHAQAWVHMACCVTLTVQTHLYSYTVTQ